MFSSDEEEDSQSENISSSNCDQAVAEICSSTLDVDARIEQALTLPDLDVNRGPGFPELPPLNLNFSPSQASEEARRANFSLSETDENFIRDSMSAMKIAPPPWAMGISHRGDKLERRIEETFG